MLGRRVTHLLTMLAMLAMLMLERMLCWSVRVAEALRAGLLRMMVELTCLGTPGDSTDALAATCAAIR